MNEQTLFSFVDEVRGIKVLAASEGTNPTRLIRRRLDNQIRSGVLMLSPDVSNLPQVKNQQTRRERSWVKQSQINKIYSRIILSLRAMAEEIDTNVEFIHTREQNYASVINTLGARFCSETAELSQSLGGRLSGTGHELRLTLGCPPLPHVTKTSVRKKR